MKQDEVLNVIYNDSGVCRYWVDNDTMFLNIPSWH